MESAEPVAVKVRERLGGRSLSEVAVELEKCLIISEEYERVFAVKNVLGDGVSVAGNNRDGRDKNDEIDLLDLAEDLLDKLLEYRHE